MKSDHVAGPEAGGTQVVGQLVGPGVQIGK
jgi:hypothetical protein